jgi:hyperosmotically inducible periplasmic protein
MSGGIIGHRPARALQIFTFFPEFVASHYLTNQLVIEDQRSKSMKTFRQIMGLFLAGDRRVYFMKAVLRSFGWLIGVSILSLGGVAQTTSASRYDDMIQSKVSQQLRSKKQFQNVQAAVEDGVVTLSGSVELYQQKLDAAKKTRKTDNVQGVRNLIAVNGKNVADAELTAQLDRKLYYDRMGLGNQFNFLTARVENGVVTLSGEARTEADGNSALALVDRAPGVRDVVNHIQVAPASNFDDDIRIRAMQAIYRDPVLSRYAIDPAKPIRIVVDRGSLSLYGMVSSSADKQIAGMRAGQVFGAFRVQNNLEVAGKS